MTTDYKASNGFSRASLTVDGLRTYNRLGWMRIRRIEAGGAIGRWQ